jgi:hypothetical protein
VAPFDVVVDPEFPGDGDWGCPMFAFDREGRIAGNAESRWGPPTVVDVLPQPGERWVGSFAAGGLGGVSGVFATPAPAQLCVVVDGLAYVVDVHNPGSGAVIAHDQVWQVEFIEEPARLLLLIRFIDIVALGEAGIAWRTPRVAVDGLRVVQAGPGGIECTCFNLNGTETITLDPFTGEQVAGTRLDSFWPPEAG